MNLKSLIFPLIINFFLIGISQSIVYGQDRPKNKLKIAPNTNTISEYTRGQKSDKKVDVLAEKIIATLSLNDQEAKLVHDLCEDRSQKIEKIKLNNDSSQQKIVDLQAINQDFDNKIKALVSPAQYQKYEAIRWSGN